MSGKEMEPNTSAEPTDVLTEVSGIFNKFFVKSFALKQIQVKF